MISKGEEIELEFEKGGQDCKLGAKINELSKFNSHALNVSMCLPTKTGSTNILKAISKVTTGKNELEDGEEWFRSGLINGSHVEWISLYLFWKKDGLNYKISELNCFNLFGTKPKFHDSQSKLCSHADLI